MACDFWEFEPHHTAKAVEIPFHIKSECPNFKTVQYIRSGEEVDPSALFQKTQFPFDVPKRKKKKIEVA